MSFRFYKKRKPAVYEGRRAYKQMAVTPEAHAKISALADKRNEAIIDIVDKIVGVR